MNYTTLRIRPYRRNRCEEAGFDHPEGKDNSAFVEVWLGGELEAVCEPLWTKSQVHWLVGRVEEELIVSCLNSYHRIVAALRKGDEQDA